MEKSLLFVIFAAILGVILLSKWKTCQNAANGGYSSVPWWFPCASGEANVSNEDENAPGGAGGSW